jgi:signal transduction histidine kinase
MNKIKILYVDDEVNNLNAFKASFRREFEISVANSSDEAMEILAKDKFNIIISDQKMPQKTGVEFFLSILDKYPDPIRILLTGYSDIDAVIDAINKGKVYSYVTKPWNEFDLRQMIGNAYDFYKLKKENKQLSDRYQQVFLTSSDLILIFEENGSILDYNAAVKSKIGRYHRSLKNIIVDEGDYDLLVSQLKSLGSVSGFECNLYGKGGKEINGLLSASINTSNTNATKNYQVIIKDITEKKVSDQQILKKIIQVQESERSRVADDLHDSLGQELSSVKMMLSVLNSDKNNSEDQKRITSQSLQVLERAISNLRNICFDLMPSALERGGFVPAFKQLIKPLLLEVELSLETESLPLNIDQQVALYRVSQEFVNNTIKHSKATKLKLTIEIEQEKDVCVIFEDNGVGFDTDELYLKNGRGQNTMLKRMESYGGKSSLSSEKNKGTKLKIKFE